MIRYNSIAIEKSDIDKFGKLPLHSELCDKLRIMRDADISLTPIGEIVILQKLDEMFGDAEYTVDRIVNRIVDVIGWDGNILLSKELMNTMRWDAGDKIAVYCVNEKMLILSLGSRRYVGAPGSEGESMPIV